MQWPVVELAEWEELRQCPDCGRHWLAAWPDEVEGGMILCSPEPRDGAAAARHRSRRHAARLLPGAPGGAPRPAQERKLECRKVGCERKRLDGTSYCIEHLIADRFGRHLAKLDRHETDRAAAGQEGKRKGPEPSQDCSGLCE